MKVLEDKPRQHADGSWHWDFMAYPTEKCDLCADRVERGLLPSCVQCCQAKVLEYDTIEECALEACRKGQEGRHLRSLSVRRYAMHGGACRASEPPPRL